MRLITTLLSFLFSVTAFAQPRGCFRERHHNGSVLQRHLHVSLAGRGDAELIEVVS